MLNVLNIIVEMTLSVNELPVVIFLLLPHLLIPNHVCWTVLKFHIHKLGNDGWGTALQETKTKVIFT